MFKIFDLNMNEIPFPDGLMPLEIFVGSIAKERISEPVPGRPGVIDYGFNYTDRPVSLFLRIKAADKVDFRLLRNEVFATFDVGNSFYVAESDVPSRVLKVVVDDSYIPDRLTEEYADFDINCRTLDSVFWENIYTTLELHDSGYSSTAEKYGSVDNIDDEKVKYRFTPEILTQNVGANPFKNGFLSSTTGLESESTTNIIIETYMNVVTGNNYQFIDEGTNGNIRFWWVYEYSEGNDFIKGHSLSNKNFNFIPEGKKLKFMAQAYPEQTLSPSDVGVNILPRLKRPSTVNTFTVYNAGNVKVEPESMYLDIGFQYTTIFDNLMTIKNITTGEVFEFRKSHSRRHLRINGMIVTIANVQAFKDTNKKFISLAPGDNQFEVTGAVFDRADFDFKYMYK